MTENKQPQEENISRHAVTERWRCYAIEQKYRWKLLRIEPTGDKTLKWLCVFEGETEFPNYLEENQ
ncbi:hypothetical protein CK510_07910 [Brunnivagina elsteri CCALA 953]|uniref:Uncharacterized protein n=1 Tax=Brunnivagina elsteri CCALA 953 TaxID=987040 RepID=A0A2A2TLE0_9CYAN|nr:hypothetical protein CK510_07910 [Calothrix elsteri CCALA 953]